MIADLDLELSTLCPFLNFKTGHTQTLIGHFVPTPDFIENHKIHFLTFPDGDQCALKIYENNLHGTDDR